MDIKKGLLLRSLKESQTVTDCISGNNKCKPQSIRGWDQNEYEFAVCCSVYSDLTK